MESINREIMGCIRGGYGTISFVLRTDIYDNIKRPPISIIEGGIRTGFWGSFRNNFIRAINENIQNGKYKQKD